MTGADVIKEYLVSVGVQVDTPAFMKFKRALGDIDSTINKSAMGWTRAFGLAGTAIVGTIGSIILGTVNMMRKVSDSDIVFQKFARQMLINESAAKSLKIATDAMGESLEDIAWNPELRSRFFSLVSDQRAMSTPGEAKGMRKDLRDITHEWTRMQVIAKYAMEWITYHLGKILGKDFKSLRDVFKSINDWLIKKMPEWTQKIAYFLAGVINIARSVIIVLKGVYSVLQSLWQSLPELGKAFAIFAGIVGAFFLSNPFGQALMMIGMVLLMLEDYVAFTEGRPSVEFLKPLWRSVDSLKGKLKELEKSWKQSGMKDFFNELKLGQIILENVANTIWLIAEGLKLIADTIAFMRKEWSPGGDDLLNFDAEKMGFKPRAKGEKTIDGQAWDKVNEYDKKVSAWLIEGGKKFLSSGFGKGDSANLTGIDMSKNNWVDVYLYLDKNAIEAGLKVEKTEYHGTKGLDRKTIPAG